MAEKQPTVCDKVQLAACGEDSKVSASVAESQAPAFCVWQARQLVRRDLAFGVFLFSVSLIYLFKTLPELCSIRADCSSWDQQQLEHPQCSNQDLWQSVCGPISRATKTPAVPDDTPASETVQPNSSLLGRAATAVIKLPMDVMSLHLKVCGNTYQC